MKKTLGKISKGYCYNKFERLMTILEEINFSRNSLPNDLKNKIKIDPLMKHYPDNPHTKYYDWNWCKDEFVPPLSSEELKLYIRNAKKFRQDLLRNLRLYIKFCLQLKKQVLKIKKLPDNKKLVSLITLLFLFQSAMDHHYYHYDYFLDLEEYPKSPLGWHYLRMKKIITNVATYIKPDNKQAWVNKKILYLLSKKGAQTIQGLPFLKRQELEELQSSYQAIQVHLKVQQEEEKLFYGKNKKGPIFTTGYAIWEALKKLVKETEGHLKNKRSLVKILEGDPIYGTRKILVDLEQLFAKDVVKMVKKEVEAWK